MMKRSLRFARLSFMVALVLLPFWFISALFAAPQATTRHVATTGADSGDCSNPAAPCATIQYAHDQAAAGDTIRIAAGTYPGQVIIDRSLILEGASAETTLVDGDGSDYTIQMFDAASALTLRRLTILGGSFGLVSAGQTLIEEAIIRDNQPPAGNHGGGLWVWGPTTIRSTRIFSNTGLYGAGIDVGGPLTITHSVIYNNSAEQNGGGLHLNGGAVVLVENSTLSGNHSVSSGGGINMGASGAQLTLRSVTVTANVTDSGNSAGGISGVNGSTITLRHSIIANNLGDLQCANLGVWQSQGYNLASDNTCQLTGTGDLPNSNPLLGPLADNGGPTLTHAIGPASPALDAGDNATCPTTDQRGRERPFDGDEDGTATCDIGAYEYGANDTPPPPSDTRYVAPNGSDAGNDCLDDLAPCRTIQHAINQAFGGETVQIAAGTYVENVILAKNVTLQGADAATTFVDGSGGAARVIRMDYSPFYDVTIRNLSIHGGQGGIRASGGALLLENSRVYDNDASSEWYDQGGGLLAWGPTTIRNSAIFSNTAEYGGGIFAQGPLTITGSAVHHNVATESGGGLSISAASGDLIRLENSTISHNQAASSGGVNVGGAAAQLTLQHTTLAHNQVSTANSVSGIAVSPNVTVILRNSLIALNQGAYQCHPGVSAFVSEGNNLASDNTCGLNQPGDLPNTNPLLGPLQDNGGATLTHALLQGSPAVNRGHATHCLTTDQRGQARPFGLACDIGAYEADGTEPVGGHYRLYLPLVIR